jgi:hypothetical protein
MLFTMLADVVCDDFSPAMWDAILAEAGLEGAYTTLGEYPDEEIYALVGAAVVVAGRSEREIMVLAGRKGFRRLAAHVRSVLETLPTWHELLLHLDATVHREVAKLTDTPRRAIFHGTRVAPTTVQLRYEGGRALCAIGEGLVLGAGDWYGANLVVEQVGCVHRGDDACTFIVDELTT